MYYYYYDAVEVGDDDHDGVGVIITTWVSVMVDFVDGGDDGVKKKGIGMIDLPAVS